MKKKIFIIIILVLLSFIACKILLAADAVTLEDVSPVKGLTGASGIATIIGRIIKAVLGTIGAFALLMFVYGGFLMLMSGGKSEEINKGKNVLVWAVIGLAVTLASYSLATFVIAGLTRGLPSSIGQFPGSTSTGPGGTTPGSTGGSSSSNICNPLGIEYQCRSGDWRTYYAADMQCDTSGQYACPNTGDSCCKRLGGTEIAPRSCNILELPTGDISGGKGVCFTSNNKYSLAVCAESYYSGCPTNYDKKSVEDCSSTFCCCLLKSSLVEKCKPTGACFDDTCKARGNNDYTSCRKIFENPDNTYQPGQSGLNPDYSGVNCTILCAPLSSPHS